MKVILKLINIIYLIFIFILVPVFSIMFLLNGDIVLPIIGLVVMVLHGWRVIIRGITALV